MFAVVLEEEVGLFADPDSTMSTGFEYGEAGFDFCWPFILSVKVERCGLLRL